MTQLAAHLVDRVIPIVQTRQYVLSLPPMLRPRLAYDHAAQKRVVGIFANALLRFYAGRARERGIDAGKAGAKTGAVTFIQRFGSALNLNLHLHVVALDGVFTDNADGSLRFHPLPPPTPRELMVLLSTVRLAVMEYAIGRRLLLEDLDPDLALDAPALAALLGASANNVRALGPRAGTPVQRLLALDPQTMRKRCKHKLSASYDGFDLQAAVSVRARRRKVLERVVRYCARPALGTQRVEQLPDGRVRLALKTPYSDGTSHMVFDPLEFIGRLTALIPRPHKNLLVYHGVLAARSKWRSRVVAYGRPAASSSDNDESTERLVPTEERASQWAALMRRAFDLDVLACPRCNGRLRLIACVQKPTVIHAILDHLGLPTEAPQPHPARAPPWAAPSDPFAAA